MKGVPNHLVALAVMALACSLASAYDPAPLQDFCVAVNSSTDAGMYTFFFLLCSFDASGLFYLIYGIYISM
jgi:hypothetical protein